VAQDLTAKCQMLTANCGLLMSVDCPGYWVVRHRVHKADPQGFLGADLLCPDKHFERTGLAHQAREPLRAAPSRDQPQGSATMAEDGVRGGDTVVARQRQVQPATHALAVNDRADSRREAGNSIHQFLPGAGELQSLRAGDSGNFLQIGAGGEELVVAGDDEGPGIAGEFAHGSAKLQNAHAGQAVGAVGGAEPQNADAVLCLNFEAGFQEALSIKRSALSSRTLSAEC